MRRLLALMTVLFLLPAGASAWTFSPDPICTIAETQDGLAVEVTFDPGTGLYALHLTRPVGWPDTPVLTLRFDQGMGDLTISTDRHRVEGNRLTVTDRGFGNVLRGLEFFGRAIVTMEGLTLAFDTSDATPAVTAFRACPATPSV